MAATAGGVLASLVGVPLELIKVRIYTYIYLYIYIHIFIYIYIYIILVNVPTVIDSGRGTTRAEDAQRTPTQSYISPSIQVYEE